MTDHSNRSDLSPPMTPASFRAWRKSLGWKQKDAADYLGLKKRIIQYYEKGNRDGKPVEIPKTVRLSCYALAEGIHDYNGHQALRAGGGKKDADS